MERVPIEEQIELHDIVTEVYNLLFVDDLEPDEIDLYYIESEHVEAEIELPYIGINRKNWEEWAPERKLEVLLHEFAHVEEEPDEPDHGQRFYERLAALTLTAESKQGEIETIFGTNFDFEQIHEHIIESVNEYTIEDEIDTIEGRRQVLREELSAPYTTQ
jgi:isocitrate dehydrogenase